MAITRNKTEQNYEAMMRDSFHRCVDFSADQSRLNSYYTDLSRQLAKKTKCIHAVPHRQPEFLRLIDAVVNFAKDKSLLELACGIGFWTEKLHEAAQFIYATDICETALDLARQRVISDQVIFGRMDAHAVEPPDVGISGVFCGFLLSHMRRDRLSGFFSQLDSKLVSGTQMLFLENDYSDSSQRRYPWIEVDGNTYESRRLKNDTQHFVLKNHFSGEELMAALSPRASSVRIERTCYYWSLYYDIDS